jgi:6-pyruvoyltetrahydropterin/6-carboxytetrahydropterin synthase
VRASLEAEHTSIDMVETLKEFTFEAAHQVPPYSGVHGHSFMVEVVVTGIPDPVFGWAASLTDFEPQIEALRRDLDHKYLNEIEGLAVPSLENIASWIWRRLEQAVPGLDRITVRRGAPGHGEGCTFRGFAP